MEGDRAILFWYHTNESQCVVRDLDLKWNLSELSGCKAS